MKICIVGLGSIGTRHLNNMVTILRSRDIPFTIDALRSNKTELNQKIVKFINKQYYAQSELPNNYDVIFITNPTALHYITIKNMAEKTKHMFIEKPIFHKKGYDLKKLKLKENGIYYIACPLRHKSVLQALKKKIDKEGGVRCVRAISTSYLPNWRKNTDYRKSYSANKMMGGGASLDLIHEWDYIIDMFGKPKKIYHLEGHFSNLEISSEDLSVYMGEYEDKLVEVHLDYLGHKDERRLELFFDGMKIEIDLLQNKWEEYRGNKLMMKREFPVEDMYLREMECFFDCIEGKRENINSIQYANEILELII